MFVVGDPYLPDDDGEREALAAAQKTRASHEQGLTWDEYWEAFFNMYPIRDAYAEHQRDVGHQDIFEGSDDGYPLSFQMEALREAGFAEAAVFWKSGLRAVYGGIKPGRA